MSRDEIGAVREIFGALTTSRTNRLIQAMKGR